MRNQMWAAFKVGIFAAMTVTMMWHWSVVEADAYCREKADGAPWAIVPGDTVATPSGAETAPMVEPVPLMVPEVDEEDLYWLSHVICGEAQSYSRECQIAVGSVVLNRVKSSRYPNTIEGVVTQRHQYSSFTDGNFFRTPTETNVEVARELLMYGSQLPSNVYFQAQFKQGDFTYAKIDGEYFCGLEE